MWPFRRSQPAPDLRLTLRELEERVYRLERGAKTQDAEWQEYQEKFSRMLARAAKRMKDAQRVDEEADSAVPIPSAATSPFQTANPLAARIMSRREA